MKKKVWVARLGYSIMDNIVLVYPTRPPPANSLDNWYLSPWIEAVDCAQ